MEIESKKYVQYIDKYKFEVTRYKCGTYKDIIIYKSNTFFCKFDKLNDMNVFIMAMLDFLEKNREKFVSESFDVELNGISDIEKFCDIWNKYSKKDKNYIST
jgi:hypothetical protein